MTKVPIACTLTADEVLDRRAEWKELLSSVVRVDRRSHGAVLTLAPGDDVMVAVTGLAEREKACCAFFDFTIEWAGLETRLHVDVPTEADRILGDLLSLLPTPLRPLIVEDM